MADKNTKIVDPAELSIEDKLRLLHDLQQVDTQVNKIKTLRGELPLEVQDLEDEITGLETRIKKLDEETESLDKNIATKKNDITQANELIKKYEMQQMNVRNNREYDSLSKEMEFQTLEIELCEKRIKEYSVSVAEKKEIISSSKTKFDERTKDLEIKRKELEDIVGETQKEEENLEKKAEEIEKSIEPRLVTAYNRIRKNARNGLAVVPVERDACGGCFNKIPPQRQVDIKSRKKIIVCEYCGRILVDDEISIIN